MSDSGASEAHNLSAQFFLVSGVIQKSVNVLTEFLELNPFAKGQNLVPCEQQNRASQREIYEPNKLLVSPTSQHLV